MQLATTTYDTLKMAHFWTCHTGFHHVTFWCACMCLNLREYQAAKRRTHWQLIVITPWRQVTSSKLLWDSCNDPMFQNPIVDVAWFCKFLNAKLPELVLLLTLSVEWSTEIHPFTAWNSGTFCPSGDLKSQPKKEIDAPTVFTKKL